MRRPAFVLLALSTSLTAACGGGDDPVSYSAPVGIELKADADKVVDTTITDEKNITTESGNPYGAFVQDARNELGRDPGEIDVTGVDVRLNDTMGVTNLNEIFDGSVEILFQMNTTSDVMPVATVTIDSTTEGGGPIDAEIDFVPEDFVDANYDDLVGGNFKVVYRGPANATYAGTSNKADLQITFTFEAFE
jgi:hypothetical protein